MLTRPSACERRPSTSKPRPSAGGRVARRVRQRLLRDAIDRDLDVLFQPRNRADELGGDARLWRGHRVDERAQRALEAEIAQLHRAHVARQDAEVLDELVQILDDAIELHAGGFGERLHAPAQRLDQHRDAEELLAHVVVQVEAESLALLLADRRLMLGEEPQTLLAAAQLLERRAQRLLRGAALGDVAAGRLDLDGVAVRVLDRAAFPRDPTFPLGRLHAHVGAAAVRRHVDGWHHREQRTEILGVDEVQPRAAEKLGA